MGDNEIETLAQLDTRLASGRPLHGARLQDLDLTSRAGALLAVADWRGVVVLGGRLTPALEAHLRAGGAVLFPADPALPVDPYRARLYTADGLYADLAAGYAATPDARAYAWYRDARLARDAYATLVRAMHDDAVADALAETADGLRLVGVMGGHATASGTPAYADAARLGADLAATGRVVVTGGGPGAMEAANLGAALTGDLDAALADLAAVPSFAPDIGAWARAGFAVRDRACTPPDGPLRSLGIPTWFYGHEPPNVFAQRIAKFFSNAIREDTLLALATDGIVVLPGAAGTVQEIFQAATRLYYADHAGPPLVLVGCEHWERELPAADLLRALGAGRAMAASVHVVDDTAEALAVVDGSTSARG